MIRPLLRVRRALVVAPHPDDEVIGAWGLMRRLLQGGARLDVIVVTDGGASHPGSRRWPPERLIAERKRETRRAMAALGVAPDRVRFLALPDGGLAGDGHRLRSLLARAVRRRAPDLIVGPVATDAHADHRAVALALSALRRRGERRLAYRVWPAVAGQAGRCVGVRLDGAGLAAKRRAIRSYRTQTGRIDDAVAGFAMTARHLSAFVRPVERFERIA